MLAETRRGGWSWRKYLVKVLQQVEYPALNLVAVEGAAGRVKPDGLERGDGSSLSRLGEQRRDSRARNWRVEAGDGAGSATDGAEESGSEHGERCYG